MALKEETKKKTIIIFIGRIRIKLHTYIFCMYTHYKQCMEGMVISAMHTIN